LALGNISALRLVCRQLQQYIDERCCRRHAWSTFWAMADTEMAEHMLTQAVTLSDIDWRRSARFRANTQSDTRSIVGCFLISCQFNDIWLMDRLDIQPADIPVAPVKYLHESFGLATEDARAANNYALRWSSNNGHLDVVAYIHQFAPIKI